jgi:hypothetical protein
MSRAWAPQRSSSSAANDDAKLIVQLCSSCNTRPQRRTTRFSRRRYANLESINVAEAGVFIDFRVAGCPPE